MTAFGLSEGDWEGALWDTVAHLQALIRLDTVNPPGDEIRVARYLDDVLRGAHIETMLLEPAPGRGAVIGRIHGTGAAQPLLLMAHMDVVPVERDKWTTNPFGGEILDGFIYGRGAIDDKGMLASNLQTMLLAQRVAETTSTQPQRDIVFLATSDEEAGGAFGIDWVLEHHRDLVQAGVALNEGGRIRVIDGRPVYCAIQCAEKVSYNVVMTATGTGGHASVPHRGNAIARLARSLARIEAHQEPLTLNDVSRGFFGGLARIWPDPAVAGAMADVVSNDPKRSADAARVLSALPPLDAVLRHGISPTLISGGIRTNVIPTEAQANLNIRLLPGATIDELLGRLRTVVDDRDVRFEVVSTGDDAPPSPLSGEGYRAICDALSALDPSIVPVPYLGTGATDSAPLRKSGMHCYGLLPFPMEQEDEDRMHGHDERVSVNALGFGVRLTYGIVQRLAFEPSPPVA
jgi:acetylornithine deacetylase/succinyl-diaminopimelate desuccinylase-like protein